MVIYALLSQYLAEPLAIIMNNSLHQRVFPQEWKEGIAISIPKTKPPELDKLRFVTLLPAPSKIMEKILLKKIWPFFSPSYGPEQHGFRSCSSTTTALTQLMDDATRIFDDSSNSGMAILSFDMSRAFDCLDHKIICRVLMHNNFPAGFVLWLKSYLCDRTVRARLGGILSKNVNVLRGVPQGSVLGPPLFCTYTGDMKGLHEEVHTMKYADDISLIIPLKKESRILQQKRIEDEIDNVATQSSMLGLQLNRSKSKAMLVTRSNQMRSLSLSIPTTSSMKILGVMINARLDWSDHISYVGKKSNQRLHLLRKLRPLI